MVYIAETYLRGYANHQNDRGTSLMPVDQKWTRATRTLYSELSEADRAIIDSYGRNAAPLSGSEKRRRGIELKRLARQLICRTGLESEYTILIPPNERTGKQC